MVDKELITDPLRFSAQRRQLVFGPVYQSATGSEIHTPGSPCQTLWECREAVHLTCSLPCSTMAIDG